MRHKDSILGIADAIGSRLVGVKPVEPMQTADKAVAVPNRLGSFPVEHCDEITAEAREIVATIFEDEDTPNSRRCAQIARNGGYDTDSEMLIAMAARRRGIVLGRAGK